MEEQQQGEQPTGNRALQIKTFVGGLIATEAIDLIAHGGWPGAALAAAGAAIFAAKSPELIAPFRDCLPPVPTWGGRSIVDRALGRYPDETHDETPAQQEPSSDDEPMETLQPSRDDVLPGTCSLSGAIGNWRPSLDSIFLGFLPGGVSVFVRARDLCHVALAGSTGGGKSVLLRLLAAQLCHAGASVLILNPHYTRYDVESGEDWTPLEPYLEADPMECRKYEIIEHFLKDAATRLLPKRLDKHAHSLPIGKPYFLFLDELPAIMKKVPNAQDYIEDILREGRKVGIFLVTAAQDFLVKTLGTGSGARECFRTALYVGGDATTARVLLDMPSRDVPEDQLGKGVVMVRCSAVKQGAMMRVPFVDNKVLYTLLGPSTYMPIDKEDEDDLLTGLIVGGHSTSERVRHSPMHYRAQDNSIVRRRRFHPAGERQTEEKTVEQEAPPDPESDLDKDERAVLAAYRSGLKTGNAIAGETGISSTRVNQALNKLARKGLIDWQPRKA